MAVKILIKRTFREGSAREIKTLLSRFRSEAMLQPGYISGETMSDSSNPQQVVVVGTWERMQNWKAWKQSDARNTFVQMLEIYQEKPTEYEEFDMGSHFL